MALTRTEHIITVLAEECNETAQRALKALRFSLTEIQPGQLATNAERIKYEFNQLYAMMEMLQTEGAFETILKQSIIDDKKKAFEEYLLLSKKEGTLAE
jgi:hypothetical protein